MFTKRNHVAVLYCLFLLCSPITMIGQQPKPGEGPGHIFTVTLLKIPLGQVSDFLDFWQKTFLPLEKDDPALLSSQILRHRWGPTDYSVFLIQEFTDLQGVESSRTREEDTLQERAKTDAVVKEQMKKFGSFVTGHVDYILFAPDSVRKYPESQREARP